MMPECHETCRLLGNSSLRFVARKNCEDCPPAENLCPAGVHMSLFLERLYRSKWIDWDWILLEHLMRPGLDTCIFVALRIRPGAFSMLHGHPLSYTLNPGACWRPRDKFCSRSSPHLTDLEGWWEKSKSEDSWTLDLNSSHLGNFVQFSRWAK